MWIEANLGMIEFQPVVGRGALLAVAVAGVALVVWQALRMPGRVSRWVRLGMAVPRLAVLGALVLLLANPGRVVEQPPLERRPVVAWMVDHSRSMSVEDVEGRARLRAALELALSGSTPGEVARLDHRLFGFAERVRPLARAQADGLSADGHGTDLPGAIEEVLRQIPAGAELGGLVVLSDGIQTAETDPARSVMLAGVRACPVYPVPLGGPVEVPDVSVRVGGGRLVSFVGHPAAIPVTLGSQVVPPREVELRLVETTDPQAPTVVDRRRVKLEGTTTETVTFSVTRDKAGGSRYRVETDVLEGELNRQNNTDTAEVVTLEEKIRILLVEGNPYWETKYLVQLLRKDDSIDIKAIFLLAPDRAFEVGEVDRDEGAAALVFPETIEELQEYNLVILGQDVRFLVDAPQAALLERYLYDFGGAVLFARGKPCSGQFPQLQRLEPVVWGESLNEGGYRVEPTEPGRALPLFSFGLDEPLEDTMKVLPAVTPRHHVARLKSFSEVLAVSSPGPGAPPVPALVVRKMGQGIVASVNAEGIWRWDFMPPRLERYRGVYPTFWGQLIRWIALRSDFLPGQEVSLRASGAVFRPDELIRFAVARRFSASGDFRPGIRISRDGRTVSTLVPQPSRDRDNVWYAMTGFGEPGAYRAELLDGGRPSTQVQVSFAVKPRALETEHLSADPGYLEALAERTGGRVLAASEVAGLVDGLEDRQVESMQPRRRWTRLWDTWWLLVLTVALAGAEWTWRRRRGMV